MNPFPPAPVPGSPVSAAWMTRMLAACRRCLPIAGPGLRASYTPNGTVLTAVGAAAVSPHGLSPFAVRWHQPDNADGQWEIYMPTGCISAGANCTPLNAAASETSGHTGDEEGWYKIPFSVSPSAGDIYDVVVHAKQRAIDAADLPSSGDPDVSPAVLAWMHKRTDEAGATTAEKTAYAGDVQSFVAASIAWSASTGGGVSHKVSQLADTVVRHPGTANQEFDLWWGFTISGATLTVPKMGLLRRTLSTGTDVATIDNPVDVSGASKGIYLRVALNGAATELTVALDVSNTTAGANFFIVQLYGVDDWHRASDYRSALWRLPMYLGGR